MATPLLTKSQRRLDLKHEALALLDLDAATRTPEQTARLDAIEAEIAVLDKDIARLIALGEAEKARAAATPWEQISEVSQLQVGADLTAERPVSFGEFLQGVAYLAMPGKAHLIPVHVRASLQAAASGASSGASSDGAFLIRSEWNASLLAKVEEASKLKGRCFNLDIGEGFDGIEAPYVDETSRATGSRWGGVQVYRAAEAASVTATKPALGRFELRLEDMKGLFYATDRVLRDATLLQSIAERAFASEFAFKLDDEILRGTGTGQCLGILNASCLVTVAKESAQTNDTIKAENVIKMYARLLARNINGAQWYVNQECLPQLQTMAVAVGTAGGQLVYMPPGGLTQAPYGTLLGRPVNVLEQCSGLGDVGDIILADFSEYLLIQKAMASASSMHVRFLFDEMTFRWTWPIIGKPLLSSAITPYKATSATTLSPFVTLAAR